MIVMKFYMCVVWSIWIGLAFCFSPFLVRLSSPALLGSFKCISISYFCLINLCKPFVCFNFNRRRETIGWVWNIRGYFEHFQSCVTVVKMQPHWWFLVCILLEHCTLTKKWNFGLNCLQNDQFTPFTYHYLVKYGFLKLDNPKSIINISKKWIFPRYPELGLCLLDVT